MTRRACVALLLAAPGFAAAQTGSAAIFEFNDHVPGTDSVYTAQTGGPFFVTPYAVMTNGLGAYTLRVYFDTSRVAYDSVHTQCPDSSTYPLTASAPGGSTYVSLVGGRCGLVFGVAVAKVWMHLKPTAVGGSLLFLDAVHVTDTTGTDRTGDREGSIVQVCHATGIWGDVDADGQITSRDALVALSAAVGLPTAGFFVSRGDVDGDGQITSRDALIILSYAIGLTTPSVRIGTGIADQCAPRAALPHHFYFARSGGTPGLPGSSGLVVRAAGGADTVGTIVGDSSLASLNFGSYYWRPRVSPADSSILFVCYNTSGYPNICHAAYDGSGMTHFTSGAVYDWSPDWSPDGSAIVFVRSGHVYEMPLVGGVAARAAGDTTSTSGNNGFISSVAWQPVSGSHRIAYTTTNNNGEVHTIAWDTTASDVKIVASTSALATFTMVDWTPAGDSLAFGGAVDGVPQLVSAKNSAGATASVLLGLYGINRSVGDASPEQPVRTGPGLLFTGYTGANWDVLLRRPDGSVVRLSNDPGHDSFSPGMTRLP